MTAMSRRSCSTRGTAPQLVDADLLEQERARHAEQRAEHLRDQFLPATRWFTGRHAALADITGGWITRPTAGRRS